jgi:hypothetical protein
MMFYCPVCGRRRFVHQPQFWPYRFDGEMFCSENCWICDSTRKIMERKGFNMARMKKDGTPAKKPGPKAGRKPSKIEIPEPVSGGKWEKMETPEDVPEVKLTGPIRIKTPDAKMIEIETPEASTLGEAINGMADAAADFFGECENKGLNRDRMIQEEDFETTAVRNKNLGEFYFDHDHNRIDWRNGFGDEVSLSPAGWKMMIDTLPKILKMLGVRL